MSTEKDELINQNILDFTYPEDQIAETLKTDLSRKNPIVNHRFEKKYVTKNGNTKHIDMHIFPLVSSTEREIPFRPRR